MRTLIVAMGLAAVAATPALAQTGGGTSTVAGGGTGFGTNVTTTDSSAGNSSAGIGTPPVGAPGTVTRVPEGTVAVIGAGSTGTLVVGNPSAGTQQAPATAASGTPTFDQAARDGRAREQLRRDRGEEPRVYGIAPNTERDLTWQMPDDRIIRY